MKPLVKKLLFATALCLGLCPTIVSAQIWQPRTAAGTKSSGPTLTEATNPSAPTIASSAALGTIVSQFTNTWSNSEKFVGANTFAAPNWDAGTYQISGDYLIIAPNGPGVSNVGGTTQPVTTVAVQLNISSDGSISNAPSGGMLANKWGIWNWGPAQAGRSLGSFTGGNVLWLNGKQVGSGDIIQVDHGGVLYVYSSYWLSWFTWDGTIFFTSGPP